MNKFQKLISDLQNIPDYKAGVLDGLIFGCILSLIAIILGNLFPLSL